MKTTYEKDGRLHQHTAVGNDDTPITYPTSPHEWMSVKAVEEKDAEIERLTAEVERIKKYYKYSSQHNGEIIKNLEAENERLTAALRRLFTWANAYPLNIFPDPDLAQVAAVLKAAGLTLDAVSASNMRHVLDGVMDTLREAGISVEDLEGRP